MPRTLACLIIGRVFGFGAGVRVAAVTGAGLAPLVFGTCWILWIVGAPHPDEFAGPVPPKIAALFALCALGAGLAVWALPGVFAGSFRHREAAAA